LCSLQLTLRQTNCVQEVLKGRLTQQKRLANIRRNRGYSYEHALVQRLNNGDWIARRLGGSSTGLPDILAVNNTQGIVLSIEAKCGTGDCLYVPAEQLRRCLLIRNMFEYYSEKHAILAFKFMRKKRFRRKDGVIYESRKLNEYFKIADKISESSCFPNVKCTYDGRIFAVNSGDQIKIKLRDFPMPFVRTQGMAISASKQKLLQYAD
jgi:Holliday junction resolvase